VAGAALGCTFVQTMTWEVCSEVCEAEEPSTRRSWAVLIILFIRHMEMPLASGFQELQP
jgi:hypothetical protein